MGGDHASRCLGARDAVPPARALWWANRIQVDVETTKRRCGDVRSTLAGGLLLNQVHALCTKFPCLGCKPGCMLRLLRLLLVLVTRCSCSRRDLLLENLALRQQLITLKQKHQRPRVAVSYKLFWVLLRRFWPEWKQALIFVQPETLVRWHRAGFKLLWEWLSRHRTQAGRKCVSIELRELIFRMVAENSTWGAPRIHGELRMLSLDISERTVLRWMRKAPRRPEPAK